MIGLARLYANDARRHLMLKYVTAGCGVHEALAKVERSRGWFQVQRKENPDWARELDSIRKSRSVTGWDRDPKAIAELIAGGFEHFCAEYLGQRLFWHQLQWLDMLEGREPRNLHPAQRYEPGDPAFILINTPPEHAKSTTISVNYCTYLIATNPNIRIKIVSKTDRLAAQFVYAIQQRLTHPRYKMLHDTFGPAEGYKAASDKWRATMFYLGGEGQRDSGEADPTVQALGLGQQIYGTRSDITILDDTCTLQNAHQFEDHIRWIQQEVITRGGDTGRVLVVGTRVDGMDLYRALRQKERYPSGESPWTYLSQPAVLEYDDDPKRWVTLWPKTDSPWAGSPEKKDADGLYTRWGGKELFRRRGLLAPRTWALAYQQADVEEDSAFPSELVRRAVNGMRTPGLMRPGDPGCPPKGMDGIFVVGGLDPATAGDTAAVVVGLDRHTGKRWVLDARVKTGASPTWVRENVKDMTEKLHVNEWIVEKNGFQAFLSQDPELQRYMANLGVVIREHFTGRNKWDSAYGIAGMSGLFYNDLIDIPSTNRSEAIKQLTEQLVTWSPESKGIKTDLVMALWFCAIKCQEIMQISQAGAALGTHLPNRYATRRRKANQYTVHLADLAAIGSGVG